QVVHLVAHHGHGPIQPPVSGQVQAEMLRMAPAATLHPPDVGGVVGMAQLIDILSDPPQPTHEGVGRIPLHRGASSLAASEQASLASWVIWSQARALTRSAGAIQVPPTQATLGRRRKVSRLSTLIPPVGQKRMPVNGPLRLLS